MEKVVAASVKRKLFQDDDLRSAFISGYYSDICCKGNDFVDFSLQMRETVIKGDDSSLSEGFAKLSPSPEERGLGRG
jgi:hypothetical protein